MPWVVDVHQGVGGTLYLFRCSPPTLLPFAYELKHSVTLSHPEPCVLDQQLADRYILHHYTT